MPYGFCVEPNNKRSQIETFFFGEAKKEWKNPEISDPVPLLTLSGSAVSLGTSNLSHVAQKNYKLFGFEALN